jgi:8-amino-7-oxononanoate synthase
VRSAEGRVLRDRLRSHVERLRPGHPSPILPVIVVDSDRALEISAALLERGFLVPAIRPPTVPPGTSRLRITVSAAHSERQVSALAKALGEIGHA